LTVAMKVCAFARRRLTPKGATDLADLRRLLLAYPDLRSESGPVADALKTVSGTPEAVKAWIELTHEPAIGDDEDEGY
jgi:hypothetical protein